MTAPLDRGSIVAFHVSRGVGRLGRVIASRDGRALIQGRPGCGPHDCAHDDLAVFTTEPGVSIKEAP